MTATASRTDEMIDLVEELYDVLATGDMGRWDDMVARGHDVTVVGTDPNEFWTGRDHVMAVTTAQLEGMKAAGFRFASTTVRAGSHGDVGWASDQPLLHLPDGTQVPMRLTLVAVPEDGRLRISQWHLSIGVANEEALATELPT